MAFDGIDLESLRLIIELQIEDAEHLIEGTNNETAAFSDNELAAELYKSELQSLEVFTSDRALSARVADDEVSEDDDGHQLCVSRPASATGPYSEEDSEQHSDKPGVGDPRLQCYVCSDLVPVSEMVHCPCSHDYCFECLGQLYTSCLGDESLYPPRCCKQPIPIALARPALSDNFISEFEAKAVEFDTPNKTYCHRPTCSVFVPPDHIFQDVATCVKCLGLTCTICKGAKHESSDCPEDEVTQEVLNFAKENGWQRCEICHRLVELDHGCNHISCRCGHQFCYVCGHQWKTCECPQWNEDRLMERAVDIVNRDPPRPHMQPDDIAALVDFEAHNLIENHNCDHDRWRYREGRIRCEECSVRQQHYIFECRQCRILACWRCRRNRL